MSAHVRTVALVAFVVVAFMIARSYAPAPSAEQLPQLYTSKAGDFSIRLPDGYTLDESYHYQVGPNEETTGIKFTIPMSVATGTNLNSDSYISVEKIPGLQSCIAGPFLWREQRITLSPDTDITPFLVASSTGAAAGNRYEDVVYAQPGTNPCFAVRYSIHFSSIANYPPGAVREFDEQALLKTFDAIRHSLKVVQ